MPARQTAQPGGLRLRLVVPGNMRHNSGGNVYNAALARELAALGVEVETCPVDGGWPVGSAADRKRLAALLCDDGGRDGGGAAGIPTPGTPSRLLTGSSPAERPRSWKQPRPPAGPLDPAAHAAGRHRATKPGWNAGRCGRRPG